MNINDMDKNVRISNLESEEVSECWRRNGSLFPLCMGEEDNSKCRDCSIY